jgi:hypothetical protein
MQDPLDLLFSPENLRLATKEEHAKLRPKWLPPRRRPRNESAGYFGYYCRMFLGEVFDIVDADGAWPAVFFYRKSATGEFRIYEEKPTGQLIHGSQERTSRRMVRELGVKIYVLWAAEKLVNPETAFPIRVQRLGSFPDKDVIREMDRQTFDHWVISGLELRP